jgi:hypothetical protein
MTVIYQEVEVEVELDDFDTDDLIEELESRGKLIGTDWGSPTENERLLSAIFEKRRSGQDYQHELDDLIYNTIGRIS